jgi:hypothetical protein
MSVPHKLTLTLALSWVFGAIFLIGGISYFSEGNIVLALLYGILAVVLFPPLSKQLETRSKIVVSGALKIAIVMLVLSVEAKRNLEKGVSDSKTTRTVAHTEVPTERVEIKKENAEEKWWIVYDAANRICAEIPPVKDGIDFHPKALKKALHLCPTTIISNEEGRFMMFNCPEEGAIGNAEFTSTREFCLTMIEK